MLPCIYVQTCAYDLICLYRDINGHNIYFISFQHLIHNRVIENTPWAGLDHDIV